MYINWICFNSQVNSGSSRMIYPRREASEVKVKEARRFHKKDGNMLEEHVQHWGEDFVNKVQSTQYIFL